MKIFSKNTWGVDVNNSWPLTRKASCLKKIELHPLISGFDFALLEVRNLCVASRLRLLVSFKKNQKWNTSENFRILLRELIVFPRFSFMSTIQITNHLTLTKRPRRVALGFPGSGLGQPQKVMGFNRLITELPTAIIII